MIGWLAAILIGTLQAISQAPRIELKGRQPSLVLPSAMSRALKEFDPKFVLREFSDYPRVIRTEYELSSHQAPFAVIGDFNGDGVLDVAVLGDNQTKGRCLVLLSSRRGFEVVDVEIEREPVAAVANQRGVRSPALRYFRKGRLLP